MNNMDTPKEPNFQHILAEKREYYGHTEAAIEFAAEEYATQMAKYYATHELSKVHDLKGRISRE